jgi:hypothetical protein
LPSPAPLAAFGVELPHAESPKTITVDRMAILAKLLPLAENILSPFESSHDIVPRELKGTMDMEMTIVNDF